jgi:hypothetical protein
MPEYTTLHGAAGPVVLEMEPNGAEGVGGNSLRDAMRVIQDIADASVEELKRLADEKQPSEFEISFGLKSLSGGGMAVSLGDDQANLRVRMKWNGASGQDVLSGFPT